MSPSADDQNHAEADRRRAAIRLVINADDFGYSPNINRGILACAKAGTVTATGVFGNAEDLDLAVAMLGDTPELEMGVHLSLSHGEPVTGDMRSRLAGFGGRFPAKMKMGLLVGLGRLPMTIVRNELYAQVERCARRGLAIGFLNSHEHLHMHPKIFPHVMEIARQFEIRWIRVTRPDLVLGGGFGGAIRQIALGVLSSRVGYQQQAAVRLVGLAKSGRIDIPYLEALFARMRPGMTYELMCHPGDHDAALAEGASLRRYHDWELERDTLTSVTLRELLHAHGIRLARFSDLNVDSSREAALEATRLSISSRRPAPCRKVGEL